MSTTTVAAPIPKRAGLRRLWDRQLPHYPDTGARTVYLAITVVAAIALYYELYVQGAVATHIMRDLGVSFAQFVSMMVIGTAIGAFASLFAGLADRWGRANLVVGGLLVTGLLIAFGLPNATTRTEYTVLFSLLSIVEGIVLVATPALVRDFSPQVGRGVAMGFWAMGPVLGSLVVTMVSSQTLDTHPDWRFQFQVCGAVGLAVFVIALIGLRELSPGLRDQLMVSTHDRALIEARAAGIDPEAALRGHWRQMLRFDIVGSSVAIGLYMMFYYVLVSFVVVYLATVFSYTEARANSLANWFWVTNVIGLAAGGVLSDKLRVRKPFMLAGGLISLTGLALFATSATHPDTGFHTFASYFVIIAVGQGLAFAAWMAAFTETVETHNPAATATGLAVWGWILRIVATTAIALLPLAVPATTTLVEKGPRLAHIAETYPGQMQVLKTVDPAALAALKQNPNDEAAQAKALSQLSGLPVAEIAKGGAKVEQAGAQLKSLSEVPPADMAYLAANAGEVAKAHEDNPKQWQTWWWICLIGQIVFLPSILLLAGRWSPRRARQDEAEHEQMVRRDLAALDAR